MIIPDFRSSTMQEVLRHMKTEQGVWSVDGVAQEIKRPRRTVQNALVTLCNLGYLAEAGLRANAKLYTLK